MKTYMAISIGLAVAVGLTTAAFAQGTPPPNEGPKGSGTAICHYEPDRNGGGSIHTKNILFGPVPTDRGVAEINHDTLAEAGEVCLTATAGPTATSMPQNAATATATTLPSVTATVTPTEPVPQPDVVVSVTSTPSPTATTVRTPDVPQIVVPTALPDTGDGTTYAD